eukprot:CAMPEP_0113694984 /NCGR_PEP_ID=MMETSP0038_2-20120614/20621_1 /TAXON_ID=2898 /ORGANISM="Cryptomonas paramecium" /LENGTH=265 /DNA_ID=CAMNT_0000617423 /DNA_START=51 /DNA_END=844 /DNA_ORIENTATION=+ /assembly_acc=CAM_ASM_000170
MTRLGRDPAVTGGRNQGAAAPARQGSIHRCSAAVSGSVGRGGGGEGDELGAGSLHGALALAALLAAAAAATAALRLHHLVGIGDDDVAPADLLAVHGIAGRRRSSSVLESHKSESTGPAVEFIGEDDSLALPVLRKSVLHILGRQRPRQAPNVELQLVNGAFRGRAALVATTPPSSVPTAETSTPTPAESATATAATTIAFLLTATPQPQRAVMRRRGQCRKPPRGALRGRRSGVRQRAERKERNRYQDSADHCGLVTVPTLHSR